MPRIAVCAPSTPITPEDAARVQEVARAFPSVELHFHDQCYSTHGHFAGDDAERLAALVECANDPMFDAVWCARGGYGANRIAAKAVAGMNQAARSKTFLGYSDAGYLLAALYRSGIGAPAHGPMPVDVRRAGGEQAVARALEYLSGGEGGLEPSIDLRPTAAFNLMTLAMVCGTDLMPDLSGHVVMVEEVSEHLYAVDRLIFHVTHHLRGIAGLRLGRVSDVPENDRPFGADPAEIVRLWCERAGIAFLGEADIGHDAGNRIVPFGLASNRPGA
ncbi:LD-carboxypeptidase [Altericroceibacterium xinjiangense]|uniref:LD-carboxypeptidase n=1 Tax=Altericroceibacterium xinjiangense TaxID=762261 RepID=UPI000F7F2205|nr:LD-carboxypeptidase [Altericroceibacterium xinjiangense]